MSSFGSCINARPIASICCSPPDMIAGGGVAPVGQLREKGEGPAHGPPSPGLRPDWCRSRLASCRPLSSRRTPPTLHHLADPRRTRAAGSSSVMSIPSKVISPLVTSPSCMSRRPVMARRVVVLPAVGAEQGHDLAVGDLEGDASQDQDDVVVDHLEILHG